MVKVNILSTDTILSKSVLYYGAKINTHCDNLFYSNVTRLSRANKRINTKNEFISFLDVNDKEVNILYNNKNISITISQKWDPIGMENCIDWPYILQLYCDCKETLDKFINESKKTYNNEILNQEKMKDKVTNYLWDDYWEVLNKKPCRDLSTLYFDNNIHIEILEELKNFLSHETEQEYIQFGIPYKYNVLLEGYPGTGKSSIIHVLASELNMNVCTIAFDRELTDKQFMRAFKNVPDNSIIILEDIDTCFKDRTEKDNHVGLTFSGLLNTLDGASSVWKQIIIMTTNFKCNLDEALIRPGRIDKVVHFDYASKKQINIIFNKFFPNSEDLFKSFYTEIKNYKLTTAMLQQFFFRNRKEKNIIDKIQELKTLSKNSNYSKESNLYA